MSSVPISGFALKAEHVLRIQIKEHLSDCNALLVCMCVLFTGGYCTVTITTIALNCNIISTRLLAISFENNVRHIFCFAIGN
jgi:uncharacterized membrane protein